MTNAALPVGKLSKDQLKQYEDEGYLLLRQVLSDEQMNKYKERARQFAMGDLPPGSEKMVIQDVRVAKGELSPADPEDGLWKYMNPDKYDELFAGYPSQTGLLDVVEEILGPDIKAFLVMFIYKPKGLDFVHPYHQDAQYFYFQPHDLCVGTWAPLDPVDAANGTISVIPGSHKWGLLEHKLFPGNATVYGVEGYDGHKDELTLDLKAGDVLFFHSRLLHKTGSNLSDRHRRVMTVHYASANCKLIADNPYKPIEFRLVRGKSIDGCI